MYSFRGFYFRRNCGCGAVFRLGELENMEIISTQRATINSVRLKSTDCIDESIKLFSNFGQSQRLRRNEQDDYSFNRDGLFIIKNLSEQDCTFDIEILKCTGDYLIVRSTRQNARTMRERDTGRFLLRAGEAWTVRASNAQGNGTANL